MNNVEIDLRLLRLILCLCLIITAFPLASEAQYKGDDIPGFLGLQSGTQAPPGIYVGNMVWVYPTTTIKDNSGHAINLPGSLTSTGEIILLNVVTNYKLFGANVGGSAGFPFIKNRIELNSLDVNTPFAYTKFQRTPPSCSAESTHGEVPETTPRDSIPHCRWTRVLCGVADARSG